MSKPLPNLISNGKPLCDLGIHEESQKWVNFTWSGQILGQFGSGQLESGWTWPKIVPNSVKMTWLLLNWNSEVFQPTYIWQTKASSICICPWEWYHVFILEKSFDQIEKSGLSKKSRFWYWPKLCPFQTIDSFYSLVTSRTKKSPIFKDNKYSSKAINRNFSWKCYFRLNVKYPKIHSKNGFHNFSWIFHSG